MLLELHKHEGGIVELVSDAPETLVFSKHFVDQAVADGWVRFAGDPVDYEVTPDPLGAFAGASSLTLRSPGDRLVLGVVKDGERLELSYRITHYPVPRSFRYADEREDDGIRIAPEYGVELEV